MTLSTHRSDFVWGGARLALMVKPVSKVLGWPPIISLWGHW